ncbi:type II toxin-antitoxin system death-on-curing family toxin [Companilactobacillus ginsenosidimutans]|uniref:type II toxin-antitoxin system death-on-curing family toxin n=1 Tax=Companilactobacillus ginsenosidimutans TaxID=1007676 RepID=UPI00066038B4|nr:type II toxin-antitoxin system death-on-curing family toxin [Companilactobacillus ginsenosidimutans]
MTKKIKYLTPIEISKINLEITQDNFRIKYSDKLNTVAMQPRQDLFGHEMYDSIAKKAGILFIKIINLHCFDDGNKRTALLSLHRFLQINGYKFTASQQQQINLTINVAKTDDPSLDYNEVYLFIEDHIMKVN